MDHKSGVYDNSSVVVSSRMHNRATVNEDNSTSTHVVN